MREWQANSGAAVYVEMEGAVPEDWVGEGSIEIHPGRFAVYHALNGGSYVLLSVPDESRCDLVPVWRIPSDAELCSMSHCGCDVKRPLPCLHDLARAHLDGLINYDDYTRRSSRLHCVKRVILQTASSVRDRIGSQVPFDELRLLVETGWTNQQIDQATARRVFDMSCYPGGRFDKTESRGNYREALVEELEAVKDGTWPRTPTEALRYRSCEREVIGRMLEHQLAWIDDIPRRLADGDPSLEGWEGWRKPS